MDEETPASGYRFWELQFVDRATGERDRIRSKVFVTLRLQADAWPTDEDKIKVLRAVLRGLEDDAASHR